jgi:excinuclease ABC subunit A
MQKDISTYNPKTHILIKGARAHNLKNIDIAIPKNKLVVITGLSGSGKSSLAFDTLYADGQRRYIESLSAYARQFFGKIPKPDVDYIKGIAPAIAIEQKVNSTNPRSTVGTSTEIYDYLKLLFARIGRTYSPISGNEVKRDSVSDVVDYIKQLPANTKTYLLVPLILPENRLAKEQLQIWLQQGFNRVLVENQWQRIEEIENSINANHQISLVIDRFAVKHNDTSFENRIADSVQQAFYEGHGQCIVRCEIQDKIHTKEFTTSFELDGITFEEPSVNLFSFNNPYGACQKCEGFGSVIDISEDLVIPNKSLSIYDRAVMAWRGEKMSRWLKDFILKSSIFDFPIHKPYSKLTKEQKTLLWEGDEKHELYGIRRFFEMLEENSYKIQYRVMLSRYRGKTECPSCQGTRLRKDAFYIKINQWSIRDIVLMPISESLKVISNFQLTNSEREIAKRLLDEIISRLQFLNDVGLGYLTLNRASRTLSGGESQRINLATSLGSSLVGSIYILDEPTIGLHARDTEKLIHILQRLRDAGNTVIVIEHDKDIMQHSDILIDIGPEAGVHGGELVFQGSFDELTKAENSLTAKYLTHQLSIPPPVQRRKFKDYIEIIGASLHNLKSINVKIPLQTLTVISGVSGSGKTSLIKGVLYPSLRKVIENAGIGTFTNIQGDLFRIQQVEIIDQNPIGKSSRSNPATYVKAYDEIRNLFAEQKLAISRKFKAGYFSFNVDGGRCPECQGNGVIKVEMQFMANLYLTCESCGGSRFRDQVLDIRFQGKNIADILHMSVQEALHFFKENSNKSKYCRKIIEKLHPLQEVGLGYIKLGQASNTLSGGEAQRIKLAAFLSKGYSAPATLFIFDEPTTGLHFHDIQKLLTAFDALINKGHSVLVIEHNADVIQYADWVIDLGPGSGTDGGEIVFEGTPDDLIKNKASITGKYIRSANKSQNT